MIIVKLLNMDIYFHIFIIKYNKKYNSYKDLYSNNITNIKYFKGHS